MHFAIFFVPFTICLLSGTQPLQRNSSYLFRIRYYVDVTLTLKLQYSNWIEITIGVRAKYLLYVLRKITLLNVWHAQLNENSFVWYRFSLSKLVYNRHSIIDYKLSSHYNLHCGRDTGVTKFLFRRGV